MKGLRKIFTLILAVSCFYASAQTSGQMAESAYVAGNYDDAAQLYDMAASLESDGASKTKYYEMAKKSRECKSLSVRANSLYSSGDYEGAVPLYNRVLALNPNDRTASARVKTINSIVAKNKAAVTAEKERKRAYKKVLADFNEDAVRAFADKYPNTDEADFLHSIWKNLQYVNKSGPLKDSVAYYNKVSAVFMENSNKQLAVEFLDMSASLADPQALYDLALLYETGSLQYVNYMVLAAEGGHKLAAVKAKSIKYNQITAKNYFNALSSYAAKRDICSEIYLVENRSELCLNHIPRLSDLSDRLLAIINTENKAAALEEVDDNALLYFAMNADKFGCTAVRETILDFAAKKGNIDAMKEYAKLVSDSSAKSCLQFCIKYAEMPIASNEYEAYRLYIKYLSTGDVSANDAFLLFLYKWRLEDVIDKHEVLEAACYMADSKFTYKKFNEYWKSASGDVYDEECVKRIRTRLASSNSEYSQKVLKKLSKIMTGGTYYNPLKEIVSQGYIDNPHYSSNPGVREVLIKGRGDNYSINRLISSKGVAVDQVVLKCASLRYQSSGKISLKYISDNHFEMNIYDGDINITLKVYLSNGELIADNYEMRKARLNNLRVTVSVKGDQLELSGLFTNTANISYTIS